MNNTPSPKAPSLCPKCGSTFKFRSSKTYCTKACAKAASRNQSRGCRKKEFAAAGALQMTRACWLSYDLNRMRGRKQYHALLKLLEAASNDDADLRRILLYPELLSAPRLSTIGKKYPDTNYYEALNISQMVNQFCWDTWGCCSKALIMDYGKPSKRTFSDEEEWPESPEEPLTAYVSAPSADFFAWLRAERANGAILQSQT